LEDSAEKIGINRLKSSKTPLTVPTICVYTIYIRWLRETPKGYKMKRIEYYNETSESWLSAVSDFENAGTQEDDNKTETRAAELNEEHEDIAFRLVDC
jgi:hypothetical protein